MWDLFIWYNKMFNHRPFIYWLSPVCHMFFPNKPEIVCHRTVAHQAHPLAFGSSQCLFADAPSQHGPPHHSPSLRLQHKHTRAVHERQCEHTHEHTNMKTHTWRHTWRDTHEHTWRHTWTSHTHARTHACTHHSHMWHARMHTVWTV